MLQDILAAVKDLLGVGADNLAWWQLGLRTVLVYFAGITLVRVGKRRFMGHHSAFDMLLGVTVGALLSTAANTSTVFLNAMALILGLGLLHALSSLLSYKWERVDAWLKGQPHLLVEQGALRREGLQKTQISSGDLEQALRLAGVTRPEQVAYAHLERNGEISIVTRDQEALAAPQCVSVEVREGVQHIVIEWRNP